MMDYSIESLKLVIESNGGIASAKKIAEEGISRIALYQALISGEIAKESHGNYILTNNQPDEYFMIQNRSPKIVFSHGTALFLQGLSDSEPHELDITVPQGDNVSRIKRDYENTRFHYCKKEIWDLGMINVVTPQGYKVQSYDLERSICELIRDKKNVDRQFYRQVMKKYFGDNCNPRKIIKYAKQFNVEDKVMAYMEVL